MPNVLNHMLAKLRKQKQPEKSLTEIAGKVGVKAPALLKLENGTVNCPTEETFKALLDVYKCTRQEKVFLRAVWRKLDSGEFGSSDQCILDAPEFKMVDAGDHSYRAIFTREISFNIWRLKAKQEVVVSLDAVKRYLSRRLLVQDDQADPEKLREILMQHPQQAFLYVDSPYVRRTGNLLDTFLFSDLVLCSYSELHGFIVTASDERISLFNEWFEDLKRFSMTPPDAITELDKAIAEVKDRYLEPEDAVGEVADAEKPSKR